MDSVKTALRKVVDYLWSDEAKDYEANDGPSGHIFESLVILHVAEYRLKLSSVQETRDFAYSTSPYDLGTDADNLYRDLVDKALN